MSVDYQELYQLRTIKDQVEQVIEQAKSAGQSLEIGNEGRKAIDKIISALTQITSWESGRNDLQRKNNGRVSVMSS